LSIDGGSTFTNAHETREIPIIAASVQRLILPRQSQVWAVLRKADTLQRLSYSLTATFLGRMCLSGEVHDLDSTQWKLVISAMELYRRVFPIIRDGNSTFHGKIGKSWRHPQGCQAVFRTGMSGKRAMLVAHTFAKPFAKKLKIPVSNGTSWRIEEVWPSKHGLSASLEDNNLTVGLSGSFRGVVVILRRGK